MTDLIQLHSEFWLFRRTMAPWWDILDTLDAARFAKTEAGEVLKTAGLWEAFVVFAASRQAQIAAADALDAVLRKNISYSRNTVREMDERNELGDLAMMLLTTMGEQSVTPEEMEDAIRRADMIEDGFPIDRIVQMTGVVHTVAFLQQEQQSVRDYALLCLLLIARYPSMNLPLILRSRMARIYRKRHPDAGRTFAIAEGETQSPDLAEEHNVYTDGPIFSGGALRDTPIIWQNETPAVYATQTYPHAEDSECYP